MAPPSLMENFGGPHGPSAVPNRDKSTETALEVMAKGAISF